MVRTQQGKIDRHMWWAAAACLGLALGGMIFLRWYMGGWGDGWLVVALFFPTTLVGIGGSIGALYGNSMRGILLALAAVILFLHVSLPLAIAYDDIRAPLIGVAVTVAVYWYALRRR